jgi:hypothetical protein
MEGPKKRSKTSPYFRRPRKPREGSKRSRSVVREVPIEGVWGKEGKPLAYIFYAGEHWFLLDQVVRILCPVLTANELDDNKGYCCLWECKLKLIYRETLRKIGGPSGIMISSCSDPYILNQVDGIMAEHHIPNRHIHGDDTSTHSCHEDPLPRLLSGEYAQQRIRQYDTRGDDDIICLTQVLLIDFQSVYELCRMSRPEFHSLLSFFLAYSRLCTGRGEARSALTKRDKEIVAGKQEWRCGACDELFDAYGRYEVDHNVALSLGGRNNESNLWAVCITCHKKITEDEMSYPLRPL